MNTNHTPTPWHFAAAQYAGIGVAHSTDAQFGAPMRTSAITGRAPLDGGEGWHYIAAMNSHTESDADAAHIVACVNAHDALTSRAALAKGQA